VIGVLDKHYTCAGDLGFESLCLVLRKSLESGRIGNIEDRQHRDVNVNVLLLAIEDRDDYGLLTG
jgi:hypothetical protein